MHQGEIIDLTSTYGNQIICISAMACNKSGQSGASIFGTVR